MKVFVTGVTGQLGHDVVKELVARGHTAIGSGGRTGADMKVFVTGVGGQLGHDVVNELDRRNHDSVGSDIQENYSGVSDGTTLNLSDKDQKWLGIRNTFIFYTHERNYGKQV